MNIQQKSFMSQREAERMFAAAVSVYPNEAVQQCGWLAPGDILDERVRRYWSLILERMPADDGISVSIGAAFEIGIQSELLSWQLDIGHGMRPVTYAQEIARRKYLSNISGTIGKLANALSTQDDTQVQAIVTEMGQLTVKGGVTVPSVQQVAERFEMVVEQGQRTVYTLVGPIDTAIGGLERQTLTILAARPSMGKTALMFQIARNQAAAGRKVIFFSAEMSAVSLWARAACPLAEVDWSAVKSGGVTDDQKSKLLEESEKLARKYGDRLILIDAPQTTQTVWQTVAEHRPDTVMFDHLRLFRDQADSEVKRLGRVSQQCKEIAKAFDCAFLLASQLSRGLESRQDKRPILSDLRDSGEIEENADVVLMMYRDSYYNQLDVVNGKSPTELWIRKFRDGNVMQYINLAYDLKQQWFERATT